MVCYHPLKGWKGVANEHGRRVLCFSRPKGLAGVGLSPIEVPCGKCIGCRLEYARQWSVRLIHEKQFYAESCFVTLTYDDEHVPKDGSLNVRDIQLFLRSCAKRIVIKRLDFFNVASMERVLVVLIITPSSLVMTFLMLLLLCIVISLLSGLMSLMLFGKRVYFRW